MSESARAVLSTATHDPNNRAVEQASGYILRGCGDCGALEGRDRCRDRGRNVVIIALGIRFGLRRRLRMRLTLGLRLGLRWGLRSLDLSLGLCLTCSTAAGICS